MIEQQIEQSFINKLVGLKYEYRQDITDRATLEQNFREKFDALNRVRLTDSEFARLLDEIATPNVFTAAKTLRSINSFTRDDGTPLNYSLVNLRDWCKNHFEVVSQLRINTHNSHHRYDVILLINGVPCVQIELKALGVNPRRAMEQIVEYNYGGILMDSLAAHLQKNGWERCDRRELYRFRQFFITYSHIVETSSPQSQRPTDMQPLMAYLLLSPIAMRESASLEPNVAETVPPQLIHSLSFSHLAEFIERLLKKCDLGRTIRCYLVLLAGEQKLMRMPIYFRTARI